MEHKSSSETLIPHAIMELLSALCDTFLPSIDDSHQSLPKSVSKFFQTSASSIGTPHQLACVVRERLKHPKLISLVVLLLMLSTRIGTFVLCGKPSLSTQFPYLQSFSEIPQKKREQIVHSWALSHWKLLRILYTAIKSLVLHVFFTMVDDNNDNPSWEAIGYCGPDPSFKKPNTQNTQDNIKKSNNLKDESTPENNEELLFGPLHSGIINLNQPQQHVVEALEKRRYHVTSTVTSSFAVECDAVVVGSGSGGGVIAGVLANSGHRVIVLEKGNYYARTNLSLLEGGSIDKMFLGNGAILSKDMNILLMAGSTVGGGSTINWSASLHTPPHVLAEWSEEHGLELFRGRNYQNALETVCEKMGVQSEIDDEGMLNMVLRKGCLELGYPVENIPRNAPSDHYCGWCTLGCKDGRKKGTAETWLVDLVKSGNAAILPGCEALRVLRHKNKAKGVEFSFERNGVKHVAAIKSKVTVVACGALSTPSLLLKSGLKNPNIGRNLHLHPVVVCWGHFPDTEAIPESKKSYEGGIMTAMSRVVSNVNGTGYGSIIQTPGLHPGLFSVLMPWVSGLDFKQRMSKFSRTAHVLAFVRDKGSGEVFSPESVTYDLDRFDEENLKIGLEKVLRILAAAGAEEIGTSHVTGQSLNVKNASKEEFERFVKEESCRGLRDHAMPICSAHQMGSCRMGIDPKTSAVGPTGETWEVEGLFVGDGSVLPTAIGVNPMVTIMAVSYCISQNILQFL